MKEITAQQAADIVGGRLISGNGGSVITNVQYDSRAVGAGTLFVPIRGEKVDAHKFIAQCFESGASAAFTEIDAPEHKNGACILVENTKSALQRLAAWHRQQFPDLRLIGVTGSVGKTSTKEMIAAAVSGGKNVMKTQGNKNSQIGMPATMFDISGENEAAVIEMGMSEFGEMDRLCDIARPDIAVMTNIGKAHIENLKTQENILSEKLKITKHFKNDSVLFLNGDDRLLSALVGKLSFPTVSFGMAGSCDYRADSITTDGFTTAFDCVTDDRSRHFTIPALGRHSVANALAAIAVCDHLGLDDEQIQTGLSRYKNAPMRQQIIQLDGFTVIDDSYNASPEATKVSIDVLAELGKGKKIAVLADMLELGQEAASEHYGVGKHLAQRGIDCLLTVGPLSENTARGASENGCSDVRSFDSNSDAANYLKSIIKPGCTVLIKGSRGMHTEEIVKSLQ